jgi:hypothetical protein
MTEDFSHPLNVTPPRSVLQPKLIPVVLKLKNTYGVWQKYLTHFPKANRFTLGSKIDDLFLLSIEYCFLASYSSFGDKLLYIDRAISRIDLLKLLLLLAFENKDLDTKKYIEVAERLAEVGRMLGGWRREMVQKTSHQNSEKKS